MDWRLTLKISRTAVFLLLAGIEIAGCSHSPPTQFYTLDAVPPSTPSQAATAAPIRVLAVRMPAALDRLEVAREAAAASVQVNDLDRWSAPVGELARAAFSQDLADRLPGVEILPARAAAPARTRDLSVEILSFRRQGDGFELNANVEIVEAATGAILDVQTLHLATASHEDSAAAEAEALSRLLASLADTLSPRLEGSAARPIPAPEQISYQPRGLSQ